MLKIEKIEFCSSTKCSYVYFWPLDLEFAFKLSTIILDWPNEDQMATIDYIESGDVFGIELINFDKDKIIEAIKTAAEFEKFNIDLKNVPEITFQ